ncbi:MAG: cation-transporting P-type ATPase [Micromonosporaceae bacterium]|nr:cation-transporting P-type ATPase [Micromonosporaceae bacterium]
MTTKPQVGEYHTLASPEVTARLATDTDRGLSAAETTARLAEYGANALPAGGGRGVLLRILSQFHHPLIYILLAATAITAALGDYVDSSVILAVVLVNAVIGYVQEAKAEAALDSLRSMVRTRARVIRDGQVQEVDSEGIVPGDVVLVEAGDKVPADLRVIRSAELRVDESALTGESVPVHKVDGVLPEGTPIADRHNMTHSGTLVVAGSGAGIAVATGAATQLGEIHRLVGSAQLLATPLTEKLTKFSKILTVVILSLAALTFAVGVLRGERWDDMFVAAIALAVGAIPEGLPAAVTITLAIGVARMARRRAVIRRLPAVETLGSTTVICSDKTGTLTENQMTVRAVWTPDGDFAVTGSGYAPIGELRPAATDGDAAAAGRGASQALRSCLLAGAVCNDARLSHADRHWTVVGDPTEGAMLAVAAKGGIELDDLPAAYPRIDVITFSSERQYMATLHRDHEHGGHVAFAKGAVERMLRLCDSQLASGGGRQPLDREAVLRAAEELAARGLRVLATAVWQGADPQRFTEEDLPSTMALAGLQAMLDPPKAAAITSVQACRTAGIAVKMVTGDHAGTATAIANQLGLLSGPRDGHGGSRDGHGGPGDGRVLTGTQLAALSDEEYPEAVDRAAVLARVSPEEKLRLVEALQARGHVVAMTGDGVNDAPALRRANIGVAMGEGGTEVAKDAADMVLTDDNFSTVEAAVEEGRGVFDNLTKFIVWTLPTNMGEGFVILAAILFALDLPILPTQILWINMTTAVLLGLMLAFEPKEPGIMRRPPRDPGQPLLTGTLIARILLVSSLLLGGSLWLFEWELANGASLEEARTAAVNVFVVVETFYLFSCRSLTRSMWKVGVFSNRWVVAGVSLQAAGQLALTYLPGMNSLFQTAPIGWEVWIRIFAIAALASLVVAADKWIRRVASDAR